MSQSNNLSPNPSTQDQPVRSAYVDSTDDDHQCFAASTSAKIRHLKAPSRRNFMIGTAALSCPSLTEGAGGRGRGSHLIALCEEFRGLERLSRDLWERDDPDFWEQLLARQRVLVAKIIAQQPRSTAEFQALARALTGWFPGAPPFDIDHLFGADCELLNLLIGGLVEAKAN
jgi:hypothetical protein